MDVEFEFAIGSEQREGPNGAPPPETEERPAPPPDSAPARRGRPFVKGQSGNPAGRPPQIHQTATVAEYLIGRKTIPLTKKLLDLALDGNPAALRLCLGYVAPPRRDMADWLGLPLSQDRAELRDLTKAVAEAAEKGAMTPAQSEALLRIVNTVLGMI